MAGGKGTRLSSISREIPKPMFPICGKPILEYQIENLVRSGILDIFIVVGHLKEVIINFFGDGKRFGANIKYIEEKEPLGTAGALFYVKSFQEAFILLFGDLVLDIDFHRFVSFHTKNKGQLTLFCHPNSHPYDSDLVETDSNNRVVSIHSKNNKRCLYYHNCVNAGAYCISPGALSLITSPIKMDLEKDLIAPLIEKGAVFAYRSSEYIKDMGTPERLLSVANDFANGLVTKRNLINKQKAIFLDRDGTINKYVGFLRNIDDFELLDGVSKAIKMINDSGYLAIVITNQPVVARGDVSFSQLDEIHRKMETELGREGAFLDDIYFCPHHPHKGFDGEVPELKIDCDCRKPKTGMITKACEQYNIDLKESWLIGDTSVDVQTGVNAGIKTILISDGENEIHKKFESIPNYCANTLLEAVEIILREE